MKKNIIEEAIKSSKGEEAGSGKGLKDIHYFKKNVYGNEHNYIHKPEIAEAHHKLTGQITLGQHHIEAYEALGHKVIHQPKN